jgi:hypothetical protein
MSDVVVITGPPGCGGEAAAELLARRVSRATVIDTDRLHEMIVVGRREPWEGAEGTAQRELHIRNACALAANFVAAGYHPIIIDRLTDETAARYRAALAPARVKILLLLPSFEAVDQRNASRSPPFAADVLRSLYESQRDLSEFDHLLDNTNLNATEVAERLHEDLFGD